MFLVLAAKKYDFKNDAGEQVAGATVQYLDFESGALNEPNRKGFEPVTIAATTEAFAQFTEVPAYYDLQFRQRAGKNGRPTLALTSAKLLQPFKLTKGS